MVLIMKNNAIILIFLTISTLCLAQSQTVKDQAIALLLDQSGLKDSVESIDEFLVQHIKDNLGAAELEDQRKVLMGNIMIEELKTDEFLTIIKDNINNDLTLEEINALNKLYDYELIKKIVSLEKKSASKEGAKNFSDFIKKIENNKPTLERYNLLVEMDDTILLTETNLTLMVEIVRGMNSIFGQNLSDNDLMKLKNQLYDYSHQYALIALHFTYKDLSDSDLRTYINVMKRTNVKKMYKSVMESYSKAMYNWSVRVAKKMKEIK
jgi:flavodoxin